MLCPYSEGRKNLGKVQCFYLEVHVSERYSKSSLCFHKHSTVIMKICGRLHVVNCTQSTLASLVLAHKGGFWLLGG